MRKKLPKAGASFLSFALFTFGAFSAVSACASDFRVGGSLGYGGAGISADEAASSSSTTTSTTTTSSSSSLTTVQRSEGPGTFSIFVDYQVSDKYMVSLETARGFRLGPFSSGVGFTGVAVRKYFGTIPAVAQSSPDKTILVVRKYNMFFGLSGGLATGDIYRSDDQVPSVQSSGIYLGFRIGADYPLGPGIGLRPELVYSNTITSSNVNPSTVTLFSLQCGLYFFL